MAQFRKTPNDLRKVGYVVRLIEADVAARTTALAQEGKHDELREILNDLAEWKEIHDSLASEDAHESARATDRAERTANGRTRTTKTKGGDAATKSE